jgi:hypothetical protein
VGHVLHPRLDQSGDRLGLHHRGIILTGQQHEFPAPVIAAPRHDGRRAARIAHHHRQALQVGGCGHAADGEADRALDLGIDDQPGFFKSRSSSETFNALRTGLRAPSQAMTQRADRDWSAPSCV